jgi:hypothetical protein
METKPKPKVSATKKQQKPQGKKIEIAGMKLPVSYEQFVKNPIAAVSFCMLVAVGYLYYDQKTTSSNIQNELRTEVKEMKSLVYELQDHVRKSDSMMSAAKSKNEILEQLKTIPSK